MNCLPTVLAHSLTDQVQQKKWLIDQLWTRGGVGIIGGEPKCCKSFLALSMAISVSSGVSCLGRYEVHSSGRVVLYAAEDAPHIVKGRLDGIAKYNNLELKNLDIHIINVPVLRLDKESEQIRLKETIAKLQPKLLILDPFVRLHRIDENSSGEVAPILAALREIQRSFQTAIAVVHHSKKSSGSGRAGQALRGSSEFHAWGDVNLYLRRNKNDNLSLSIEHRDAKSQAGIPLELTEIDSSVILKTTTDEESNSKSTLTDKIFEIFESSDSCLSLEEVRVKVRARSSNVCKAIKSLLDNGQLEKVAGGYKKYGSLIN